MTRYLSAAERAARHAQHARELSEPNASLDVIAELADEPARNDNEPPRRRPFDPPELLQRKVIEEWATIDGAFDAAINRPPSAAFRFCESALHYNNYPHMRTYFEHYGAAFKAEKERLK